MDNTVSKFHAQLRKIRRCMAHLLIRRGLSRSAYYYYHNAIIVIAIITGDHIKYLVGPTLQKTPQYFAVFINNSWSYLLFTIRSPVIIAREYSSR